jgi:Tol biopolymer transport system component
MKNLFLNLISFLIILTVLSCGGRDETDLVIFFNLFEAGSNYICSINEDGKNFKKIAGPFEAVTTPVCSPDGSRIVFSKTDSLVAQIWTMDTDGSNMKQETSPTVDQYHYFPTWSADSRYIYFVQYELPSGFNFSALYKLDMKTGQVTSDSSHSYYNANAVACYEDYIAYNDYGPDYTCVLNSNTYSIVFQTGITGLYYPTFFYDGRLLVSQSSLIYIYESDFSSYSTIDFTAQGLTPTFPAVSPDGNKIVFVDSGSLYLWIYDIKAGGNAVLLKSGTCTSPNYLGKPR